MKTFYVQVLLDPDGVLVYEYSKDANPCGEKHVQLANNPYKPSLDPLNHP